ncbi:hypothetical protein NHX12_010858 [Muraenolepis orangiensis]|uniref:Uncharacterized protein n=1 Tax=Muraenolepis orangiensis TaxID=630683 RepID=A0A9Q0I6L7_9TELE|nr:hypothetical protein NHX12_010858 [Muraenolepis orangiensis]
MTMFQHSNKKCFTIESLVGKETTNSHHNHHHHNNNNNNNNSNNNNNNNNNSSNSASSAGEHEPIRPTALRFTESIHSAPFGTCFQNSSGRSLYSSSSGGPPDVMFQDPGGPGGAAGAAHCTQSPGLHPLHPLQMPSQAFFSPHHHHHHHHHQREALNFYPWVLRNKYLGHRFPGKHALWGVL